MLFSLTGTAFGTANYIAIANINTQVANINCTDLLVAIAQIYENNLYNINKQLINIDQTFIQFFTFYPSLVVTFGHNKMAQVTNEQGQIENAVS